jgi:hypothetical protein
MSETLAAETWIYSVLSADATLASLVSTRIYSYAAPKESSFPVVVYGVQTPSLDIVTQPLVRIASRLRYQVKAVWQGNDFVSAGAISARIDALLQAASGSNSYGVVAACYRDMPISYLENDDEGVQYSHAGGLYRIIAQAT